MTRIRTIEDVVAAGGWHECGCGIPSRARYRVVIFIVREVNGYTQHDRVEWFACVDHLDQEHSERMLDPDIRTRGWTAVRCVVTEQERGGT